MTDKLKVLDLFSGIGGFSLGLERTGGFETVAFCEIDPYCRRVLAKHWPDVPIYEDVRELHADGLGRIDLVCGGYPCQPFSHAGKRRGKEDDRHLWPEMYRLVDECRPSWVIGENVAGHISMGLDDVLSDLEALDYACRTFVIPACAVDAPHRRDRVWTVGYSDQNQQPDGAVHGEASELPSMPDAGSGRRGSEGARKGKQQGRTEVIGASVIMADADSERGDRSAAEHRQNGRQEPTRNGAVPDPNGERLEGQRLIACGTRAQQYDLGNPCRWLPEPDVGRVAHGVSHRMDRLRTLGNTVVPQIPELIGNAILAGMAA
jgi:DNA (cytosine-5)-methyltransferase 1